MRRSLAVILGMLVGAACGGGHGKGGDTTPDEGGGDDATEDDGSAGMVKAETLEEIQHSLDRKRTAATRCLTKAIDDGEAEKNATGKITLVFVISPAGRASDIKVEKSNIESQQFLHCVVDVVAGISFPELPQATDWSYTYAFEAF
jgi:hypothetical protein